MFGFRIRHLTHLKVAPVVLLRVHLTAARDAPALHPDLLVVNNMARLVASMELLVVPPGPRVDPRHPSRSMRIVAC
jgi:hypothetical protein